MAAANQVVTHYLGDSAWFWTAPARTRVVIDPYDNTHPWNWRWFLRPFPEIQADVVLVTHDHFDHNATWKVAGDPQVVRSAQELRRDDISILGVQDRHASPDDMPNTIFVLEACGIRYCHLGDNRAELPESAVEAIGHVDVLMVPVDDSSHLLRFWEVRQLVATLKPRVVVPMHYLILRFTDPGSTLLTPDTWLATQADVRRVGTHTALAGPHDLPKDREVWVFDAATDQAD